MKGCFSCLILFFREARGQCCHVCVGGWQDGDHPAKFSHPQPTAWWAEQESLGHLTINLRGERRRPGPRCILGRRRVAQDGRAPQPCPLTLTSESLKEEKKKSPPSTPTPVRRCQRPRRRTHLSSLRRFLATSLHRRRARAREATPSSVSASRAEGGARPGGRGAEAAEGGAARGWAGSGGGTGPAGGRGAEAAGGGAGPQRPPGRPRPGPALRLPAACVPVAHGRSRPRRLLSPPPPAFAPASPHP